MEDIPVSPIHTNESFPNKLPPATSIISAISEDRIESEESQIIKKSESDNKKIRRKNNVNEETLKIIHNMYIRGYKAKEIAIITELTKSTVYKYIERMNDENPQRDDMSSLIRKRGRKKSENILKDEGHDISISYLSKIIKKMGLGKRANHSITQVRRSNEPLESFSLQETLSTFTSQQQDMLPPPTGNFSQ
ncbi:Helix-turn-helix domain of resolvase domain-containing protein [Entamoeba histolytica HM-1:IMSS-B]|uniref:Helix-turn-helix domain of resolvase domain-containing protein n=1 Tax=Entamoeba histolytica HM-1:IMSS-B TaxID=885319 RepID=M3SBP6_ENTH1|nr:Helix-turn-helix domain of resolvase domain-containing protein [Entamoeba histolytica HM-1:IMSS-B]